MIYLKKEGKAMKNGLNLYFHKKKWGWGCFFGGIIKLWIVYVGLRCSVGGMNGVHLQVSAVPYLEIEDKRWQEK